MTEPFKEETEELRASLMKMVKNSINLSPFQEECLETADRLVNVTYAIFNNSHSMGNSSPKQEDILFLCGNNLSTKAEKEFKLFLRIAIEHAGGFDIDFLIMMLCNMTSIKCGWEARKTLKQN